MSYTDYTEVELTLRATGDGHTADLRFRRPNDYYDIDLPRSVPVVFDLFELRFLSSDWKNYGRALTAQLFREPSMRKAWAYVRTFSAATNTALRLRLRIAPSAQALHALRWELLQDPETGAFLTRSERITLFRVLDTDQVPFVAPARSDLRALVAVAGPTDLGKYNLASVDVAGEVARASAALSNLPTTLLAGAPYGSGATLEGLLRALRNGYPLVTLVCHASINQGRPVLWLEHDDGSADHVSGEALVWRIANLPSSLRPQLIILLLRRAERDDQNADVLAALAPQLVSAGVGAVIGMLGNAPLSMSEEFFRYLLSQLRIDGQIDRALALARRSLSGDQPWWMPALFMRMQDGRLWARELELSPAASVNLQPSMDVGPPRLTTATKPQAHLNVRFDGYEQASQLPANQWLPLAVGVGARATFGPLGKSQPFAFQFQDESGPVEFSVSVYGDPEVWEFRLAEDLMIVELIPRSGLARSVRDALLLVRAKQTGKQKLYIRVAQKATGTVIQNLWLYLLVGDSAAPTSEQIGNKTSTPPIQTISISQPLDLQASSPYWVHLIFEAPSSSARGFPMRVDARLPDWVHDARYEIPVSEKALSDAAARLRRELEKIVNYYQPDADEPYPFLSKSSLLIDDKLMRQAAVALADAGRQIWDMLFGTGKASPELKQAAKRLRNLEPGTVVEIRLENPKFCLPWALLYDKPGPITAETIDWSGFWGYRFDLRTLYPGDYPGPVIDASQLDVLMAFCDDQDLGAWIDEQQSVFRERQGEQCCTTTIGANSFLDTLQKQQQHQLMYALCYGHRAKRTSDPLALPAEAAVFFSPDVPTRVADLRRLELEPFAGRPLIFMNSCEGVSRDPEHHDDFAAYFIEDQQARGCIGTEVIVPKYLAHRFALDFLKAFVRGQLIGPTLWRLRREYLDTYHNILAFNYTLYGNGDIRLSKELAAQARAE